VPLGETVIDPPFSTTIVFARIVRSPLVELSVAPDRTTTGPSTMTSPFLSVALVTSSIARAHVPE
jgi:hypothetical protein